MSNTKINWPLLERVIEHIIDHPEEWNQEIWIRQTPECGTQACVAGWTALFAGYRPIELPWYRIEYQILGGAVRLARAELTWQKASDTVSREKLTRQQITDALQVDLPAVVNGLDSRKAERFLRMNNLKVRDQISDSLLKTGRAVKVRQAAQEALGLDRDQGDDLFMSDRSLRGILDSIRAWAEHDHWGLSEKLRTFDPDEPVSAR